jgi:hypothetical protein
MFIGLICQGNISDLSLAADQFSFCPIGTVNALKRFQFFGDSPYGVVFLEHRILPEGWVIYSAAPTLDTYYGAGFWTNRGSHGDAAERIRAGMPEDAFYGSGNLGQRIVIIPSWGLVVMRLGLTHSPGFDMRGLLHLVADTSAALKSP